VVFDQEKNKKLNPDQFRIHLEQENIESRPLWKPMHLQPLYKNKQFFGGKIAEELFQKGLCLPSGSNLTLQEKDRIQNTILSFLDQ
jgi:dTDP-4-amino-4,6-dideoxygalactose transaminase